MGESLHSIHSAQALVLSVAGPHAGEDMATILTRKAKDITVTGRTFWFHNSKAARPPDVQQLALYIREHDASQAVWCVIIAPKGKVQATSGSEPCQVYSADGQIWVPFPAALSLVTGNINKGSSALAFGLILPISGGTINLGDYANFKDKDSPIKIRQGASTLCAIRKNPLMTATPGKKDSRTIVAIARLIDPFAVWIR